MPQLRWKPWTGVRNGGLQGLLVQFAFPPAGPLLMSRLSCSIERSLSSSTWLRKPGIPGQPAISHGRTLHSSRQAATLAAGRVNERSENHVYSCMKEQCYRLLTRGEGGELGARICADANSRQAGLARSHRRLTGSRLISKPGNTLHNHSSIP